MESAEDEDRPSQKQSRICNKRELLWSQARAGKWAPIGLMAEKHGEVARGVGRRSGRQTPG